jgi:large subunit ribosomal protein L30
MSKKLRIRQVRSVVGRIENQKRVMKALGIHKTGQSVVHEDVPSIRGMIGKVKHLVEVSEVDGE